MAKMTAAERKDGDQDRDRDREEMVLIKTNKNNNKNCKVRNSTTKKRMRKSSGNGAPSNGTNNSNNSRDSPPGRSSIYRGVTRHRWTGRYEAHLWDKCTWNESQNKKGRQVYLGAYDDEAAAARAYDLAALKYWGPDTLLNFPLSAYGLELHEMEGQSKEEFIGSLRRKSSGFSRGVSKYRGVARHHHNGRWEARIGRVFGNKYLYLGTYATQEEAATAYDMAAIEYRGLNAVTNFDLSRYVNLIGKRHEDNNNPDIVKNEENDITNKRHDGNNNVACSQTNPKVVQEENNITNNHNDAHETTNPTRTDHNYYIDPRSDGTQGFILKSKKLKKILARASSTTPDSQASVKTPRDSDPPRKIFPDDIQTYFGCQESSEFAEVDDVIFAELDSITSTFFQCEMDI